MENLRRFIQKLASAGYQLDRSAFDYIKTLDEPKPTRFEKNLLVKLEKNPSQPHTDKGELVELTKSLRFISISASVAPTIPAKQISSRLEILKDPSKQIGTGSGIEDFSHYFRDRFHKLTSAFMNDTTHGTQQASRWQ